MKRSIKSKLFVGIMLFSGAIGYAQTKFSYRIINENVSTFSDIDEESAVNPGNIFELNELEVVNRFFPIGTFSNDKIKIHTEPRVLVNPLTESVDFSVNELYAQYGFSEKLYLTMGKKRVNWGTGNVWNPSNPFLQKDPFRIDNRLEGIFLTDVEYIFSNLTLNALFSASEEVNSSTFALRATSSIKSFSYSLSYAFLSEERQQFGADFSWGASNFTFYGEGILRNFSNSILVDSQGQTIPNETQGDWSRTNSEFLLGTFVNLSAQALFILEYRYRSDFNTEDSFENFRNFLPNNGEAFDPISMGRHSFFGQLNFKDAYEKSNITANAFYDPITNQLLISPGYIYNGNDFKLEINPFIYNNALSLYNIQGRVVLSFFL